MTRKTFGGRAFLGGMAKGFGQGVKLGLDMVEARPMSPKARQRAEAQAARTERTMRAAANLHEPKPGTPVVDGGLVNVFETQQAQAQAREAAARPPRTRKPR